MAKLTPAAKRALLWLHAEGGETIKAGRNSSALNSLSLCGGPALVIGAWGDYGQKGGRVLKWTLTQKGIALAKELSEKEAR